MKNWSVLTLVALCVLGFALWQPTSDPKVSILSFKIDDTYEDVVDASSYPVAEHSNVPVENHLQAGQTFVTEPAVALLFNDPDHGFSLPPTKFAMIGYMHNKVQTVATSPMLEKLPFEKAIVILEELQNQFKAGGWQPWREDGSVWFDLTNDGKKRLFARLFDRGFSHETTLRVPNKYAMTFRIWCAEGCMSDRPPYLFLIDIGISSDTCARIPPSLEPLPARTY